MSIKQIYDYIALDSTSYAEIVASDIAKKTEILNIFPKIGKVVIEINESNIREICIYSYRLIYEILLNEIVILALVHSRRKLNNLNLK